MLLAFAVILLAGFLLFPLGARAASARGQVELEISFPKETRDDGTGLKIVQDVSWQGQIGIS